eukprot:COSAG05_NODE_28_length_29121_cov_56.951933_4_plen_132_part_00
MMLWNVCGDEEEERMLATIREKEGFDWRGVYSFRTKEDAGHEPPWHCFLQGENEDFPVQILQAALAQVFRRCEQVREDNTVGSDGRYDRAMEPRNHGTRFCRRAAPGSDRAHSRWQIFTTGSNSTLSRLKR